MMGFLFLAISFLASMLGSICGVGGGVIIKPVLDAAGVLSVATASFLSGCTVLSMSVIAFLKNRKAKGLVSFGVSTPLAVGAIFGGITGKLLFDAAKSSFPDERALGGLQAVLLFFILLLPLCHTLFGRNLKTYELRSVPLCGLIGFALGALSAFLGIGGGPINLTVLMLVFSMDTKKAAANSLYIILFSQLASLIQTFAMQTVPVFNPLHLLLMVLGGIIGGIIGNRIYRRISTKGVQYLFVGFILIILLINTKNLAQFLF